MKLGRDSICVQTGLWCALNLCTAVVAAEGTESRKPVGADHVARMREALALFRETVKPALVKNCVECHSGPAAKAGFDLTTRQSLGESGMLSENAEESGIYRSIAHLEKPFMPNKRPQLPAATIAAIKRWIDLGAPYDGPLIHKAGISPPQSLTSGTERNFWSFRPLTMPDPPAAPADSWIRTPIDSFVSTKLHEHGLTPNPPAQERTLVRRLYLDLLGLPPTPEEAEHALVGGDNAYESLVDKL